MEGESSGYNDGEYYSNLKTFKYNMCAANVDKNRVTAIKGNFLDILDNPYKPQRKYNIRKCSVVHIDCGVYVAV